MANEPGTSVPSDLPERGDAAQDELRVADTKGGSITAGDVSGTGIAIGPGAQANVTFTEERAYNVAGLSTNNPYLGLSPFTAAKRHIFAGRERIVRTLVERLSAEDGDRLLIIVGASGSGKSSLARAGLLPELADRMRTAGYDVQPYEIDHPGPLLRTTLIRFLKSIRPASDRSAPNFLLVLIDQFEELFSQVDSTARGQTLDLLAKVASSLNAPLRIIATMRSDFLPQLLADPRFETAERRKVVVRAMTEDELRDAIQRPIQVLHPEKHIEPALLEELVKDAAVDAAYLPLLQVTLEDLWRRGQLRRGAYHGLADAIQRRADAVYTYRDYDGLQQEQRPSDEQKVILELFLALVRGSFYTNQPNVRWRRPRAELTQGDPDREQLINDLINDLAKARLLRTDHELLKEDGRERVVETVDIVHETLLNGWKILSDAIKEEQELLRRRERFDLARVEWLKHEKHDDYLLTGVRLAEAKDLKAHNDGVFLQDGAKEFYDRSVTKERDELEAAQQRAANLERALKRERELTVNLEHQLAVSHSQALAFAGRGLPEEQRETALLLAIEAVLTNHNPISEQALRDMLDRVLWEVTPLRKVVADRMVVSPDSKQMLTWVSSSSSLTLRLVSGQPIALLEGHDKAICCAMFSPDGSQILTAAQDGIVRVWARDGQLLGQLEGEPFYGHDWLNCNNIRVAWSNDGRSILVLVGGRVQLWEPLKTQRFLPVYALAPHPSQLTYMEVLGRDNSSQTLLQDQDQALEQGHIDLVTDATFSPDGQKILTVSRDGTARLWSQGDQLCRTLHASTSSLHFGLFDPDGQRILTGGADYTARLWAITGELLAEFKGHDLDVSGAAFRQDGQRILTCASDHTAKLWGIGGELLATFPNRPEQTSSARIAIFSRDNHILTTDNGVVSLWDADGKFIDKIVGHAGPVTDACFVHNSQQIMTFDAGYSRALEFGTARLWRRAGPPLPVLAHAPGAKVTSAVYLAARRYILTNTSDGPVTLWDSNGQELARFAGYADGLSTQHHLSDRPRLLTTVGKQVFLWDLSLFVSDDLLTELLIQQPLAPKPLARILCDDWPITTLLSRDGKCILTLANRAACLWRDDGSLVAKLQGSIDSVCFSPVQHVLTASNDGEVRIYDADGALINRFDTHDEQPRVTFDRSGQRILVAAKRSVQIWDRHGSRVANIEGYQMEAAYSPDAKSILVSPGPVGSGEASLHDVDGNFLRRLPKVDWGTGQVAFSRDGRSIRCIENKLVRMLDLEGNHIALLRGHDDYVTDVVMSHNGCYLLTASADNTARLWSADGQLLTILNGHTDMVNSVEFSPDDQRVLTASADGTVGQYLVHISDVLKVATARVGRNLLDEELARFNITADSRRFDIANSQIT
jgi:WD40 repeat protein/ABC-type dipeptide/oligopeptide/nickel transport system ATPase component